MNIEKIAKIAVEEKGSMQKISELAFLLEKMSGSKIVVEIGTAEGGTFWGLSQVVDDKATVISISLPGKVFSINQYDEEDIENIKKLSKKTQKAHIINCDSHSPLTLKRLEQILDGRKIDFLFIDADHTWLGAKTDWLLYSPLVKNGGKIGFHDVGKYPFHGGNFCEVDRVWEKLKSYYKNEEFIDKEGGDWGGIGVLKYDSAVKIEENAKKPLVSIIVPIRYRTDLTKVCLDSIEKYTENFELILVQEGENEEITKLLKSYKAKFVQNKKPKGFAGAMNTGLSVATGEYFCFLNNDTVVTPGWLDEMLKVFEDGRVGLVAPTLTDTEILQSVDNNRGQIMEPVDDPLQLKGVCFLISKKCLDKVGKWDEKFGLGGGDDNDMCIRIKKAEYQLVVARKSYVYHYGSASFRELFNNDIEYSKKFATGQFKKLDDKYKLNSKPHVMIAIPTSSGNINYALSVRLIEWSHDPDIKISIKFYPHLAPLDNARNRAVKDFLEDYYTHLLFIDDDIIPQSNCLRELLVADKEVIAPLCFTWGHGDDGLPFPQPVAHRYNKDRKYEPYFGEGIEETDVVTGGMFLVKREVFEKLERPFYFTYHKNGVVIYSEDFVFSQQCQKLGYKLYTHYGLPCGHIRSVDVKGINDLMVKYGK
jgi:GT2 family glycosyltransferase/predicted O-methyltransferase YrrM